MADTLFPEAPAAAPEQPGRAPRPTRDGTCSSCGAAIVFMRLPSGAWSPLEKRVLSVVNAQGEVVRGRESHFARCSKANTHRKRGP